MTASRMFSIGFVCIVGAGIAVASIPPARAAIAGAMSCALSTPCLEWDNTGSGDAIKGVSSRGNALHGQTRFNSTGKSAGRAGVFGEDVSTSGNLDSGVTGVSTNGTGVTGTTTTYNGVIGFASGNGSGVYGQNSAAPGYGVAGRNTSSTHDNNGAGVLADGNTADDGLHAFAYGASATAVYAFAQYGSAIVANQSVNATAPLLSLNYTGSNVNYLIRALGPSGDVLDAYSSGWVVVPGQVHSGFVVGNAGAFVTPLNGSGLPLQAGSSNLASGADLFDATSQGLVKMSLTDEGNLTIDGLLYSQGSCNTGCLVNGARTRGVGEYAPVEAQPTIEDNGEASLSDGRAFVALDPKFANVISTTATYIVQLTPEGDSKGLYVASRGPTGFTVVESQGGRSNVGFAYRIVAQRYGVHAPRLPMMAVKRIAEPNRTAPERKAL